MIIIIEECERTNTKSKTHDEAHNNEAVVSDMQKENFNLS